MILAVFVVFELFVRLLDFLFLCEFLQLARGDRASENFLTVAEPSGHQRGIPNQ
jgi:hypothetical protein